MARLVLEHVSKIFRSPSRQEITAVEDLSLEIAAGELLVLVGPSGSGKTTVLRLIAGLEEISAGTIEIDGRPIQHLAPKDRDVSMVFQNYALYPHMTVLENMVFALKLRRIPKPEIQRRVDKAAALLGLIPLLERLPQALSGGQRQRVAVGRALVTQPKVLLLDEPLSNVDAQLRLQLRMELLKLHQQLGTTMIYVTHDQSEAMTLGQRIAVLARGQLQQAAEPLALYQRPANVFVASFVGSPGMNFWRGWLVEKEGSTFFRLDEENPGPTIEFKIPEKTARLLAGCLRKELIFGIRPEAIVAGQARGRSETEVTLGGTLELVELAGSETVLYVTAAGRLAAARAQGWSWRQNGEQVTLTFAIEKGYFFDAKTKSLLAAP